MLILLPFIALFAPFLSAVIVLFTHKRFSYFFVSLLTISTLVLSLILTLITWQWVVSLSGVIYFDFAEVFQKYWICSNWTQLSANFIFDELCLAMFILVIGVSLCVHVYSVEYMHLDPDRNLFFAYLSLFTFFMLILVSSGNFIQFFVGWEGIGMCSYLLINFWYMRVEANKAAIKAVVVNKIGDCAFLLGVGLIYLNFKTFNMLTVANVLSTYLSLNFIVLQLPFNLVVSSWTMLAFFFLLAVMAKSAQIGLHTWLPDAMEGPTPVSALIHAATMVTAGIFLVIRCSKIFEMSEIILQLMVIVGALTAFFAASVALVQSDIKKIIAYSTCSQLGYMLTACGLSKYGIAFFHLFTHGFFKALLFLCAGAILHGMADDQDLRRMGALGKDSLFLYVMLLIGSLALTGFPFLSGFYSKELIIFSTIFDVSNNFGFVLYFLLILAAILTTLYSFRLFYLAFLDTRNVAANVTFHSSGLYVNLALFVLSFGAIFVGFVFSDYFINYSNEMEVKYFFSDDQFVFETKILIICILLLNLVLFVSSRVLFPLFTTFYWQLYFSIESWRTLVWFFSKKWYFDKVINTYVTRQLFSWAYRIFYVLDVFLLEQFGPRGFVSILLGSARKLSYLQTGSVFFYLVVMIFSGFLLFYLF